MKKNKESRNVVRLFFVLRGPPAWHLRSSLGTRVCVSDVYGDVRDFYATRIYTPPPINVYSVYLK